MGVPIRRQIYLIILILVFPILIPIALKVNSRPLSADHPFTQEIQPNQLGQRFGFILEGNGSHSSETKILILRKGMGSVRGSYRWDWIAPDFQVDRISIIDLDKRFERPAVLSKWRIALSKPTALRMKVWRLINGTWRVVRQTPSVNGSEGMNEYTLPNGFKVESGDFLGLYFELGAVQLSNHPRPSFGGALHAQMSGSLQEAAKRHRQITFAGDKDEAEPSAAIVGFKPGEYAWEVDFSEAESIIYDSKITLKNGISYYEGQIDSHQSWSPQENLEFKITVPTTWEGLILKSSFDSNAFFPQFLNLKTSSFSDSAALKIGTMYKLQPFWLLLQWSFAISGVLLPFFRFPLLWRVGCLILLQALFLASQFNFIELHVITRLIMGLSSLMVAPGLLFLWFMELRLERRLSASATLVLSFCLSLGIWIPFAHFGFYRAIPSHDLLSLFQYSFLSGAFILLTLAIIHRKRHLSLPDRTESERPNWIMITYLIGIAICMSLSVLYSSQFQAPISDALAHIAGFRNIASDPVISNCDHILGSQMPMIRTYACNFWYLQVGLSSKLANVDITIMYCLIAGFLVVVSIASAYHLAHAIIKDSTQAMVATILGVTGIFLSEIVIWTKYFYNIPMTWLPFPYHVAKYILLPTLIASFLHLTQSQNRWDWVKLGMILLPALFIHPVFTFHISILSGVMAIIWFLRNSWLKEQNRGPFILLTLIAGAAASYVISIAFCKGTGPLDVFGDAFPAINMWKGQGNLFYVSPHIYGLNPLPYIIREGGWRTVLGIILLPFILQNIENRWFSLKCSIILGVALTPFLIACNVFLVPILVSQFHTSIPFYRSYDVIAVFLNGLFYTEIAWIFWQLLQKIGIDLRPLVLHVAFGVFYLTTVVWFIQYNHDVRNGLLGSLNNWGWYPSILDRSYTPLNAKLATLGKGRIVLPESSSQYLPAVTDLDPLTTFRFRAGDSGRYQEFSDVNNAILNLSAPLETIRSFLIERQVGYVLIPVSSPELEKFYEYSQIFIPIFHGGTDVLFQVQVK